MTKSEEQRKLQEMYERDNYICQHCGCHVIGKQPQRAHVLGQGKLSRKMFGNKVIDSIHNWKTACSLECNNAMALNFMANPIEAEQFAKHVLEMEYGNLT